MPPTRYLGGAIDNINNSQLDELVVANSIPLSDEAKKCKKIRTLHWQAAR